MVIKENKRTIFEYGDSKASTVLIQPVDGQDLSVIDKEIKEIIRLSKKPFRLIAVKIDRWNHDLSPWAAPPVFGKENFGDGAGTTLKEIKKLCDDKDKAYIIGGYSLAALFSLWAVYQTDVFEAAAAASPSVWFPGFLDYMKTHEIMADRIYLSLGDKEEKTRNPIMASVGNCIREAADFLAKQGINSVLEWNQGNHFNLSFILFFTINIALYLKPVDFTVL